MATELRQVKGYIVSVETGLRQVMCYMAFMKTDLRQRQMLYDFREN